LAHTSGKERNGRKRSRKLAAIIDELNPLLTEHEKGANLANQSSANRHRHKVREASEKN